MSSVSLSEKEKRLLSYLKKQSTPISLTSIAQESDFSIETVRSLVESLTHKKLIERQVEVQQVYRLTSEAKRYATKGLPEIRLVRALERLGREASVDDLKSNNDFADAEIPLALGWARQNGWITVTKRNGKTYLKLVPGAENKAAKDLLQLALHEEMQQDVASFSEEIGQILIRRRLATQDSQSVVTIIITKDGFQTLQTALLQEDQIGDLTSDLLISGLWHERPFRAYNLKGPVRRLYSGKKHPYIEFIDRVYRSLIGLGFQEATGPLVELEFWNSDALFMPQDHVARDVHDVYHIKTPRGPGKIAYTLLLQQVAKTHEDGWTTKSTGWQYKYSVDIARRLVLRSQTTAVSVRYLAEHPEAPLRMFCIDRNFRPEKFDVTHSAEFLQCEGIIGGTGLTLRDLMGYLRAIAESVGIHKIKFKPGFFPFTEPSIEGSIYMPELGWLEALPGGIFRPEVTRPLGVDFPVLAWGIGIDRLAMAALGVHDIRELATRNLERLRHASLRF